MLLVFVVSSQLLPLQPVGSCSEQGITLIAQHLSRISFCSRSFCAASFCCLCSISISWLARFSSCKYLTAPRPLHFTSSCSAIFFSSCEVSGRRDFPFISTAGAYPCPGLIWSSFGKSVRLTSSDIFKISLSVSSYLPRTAEEGLVAPLLECSPPWPVRISGSSSLLFSWQESNWAG